MAADLGLSCIKQAARGRAVSAAERGRLPREFSELFDGVAKLPGTHPLAGVPWL